MKIKYTICFCLIVVFLMSIAGVSASEDVNQTLDDDLLSADQYVDEVGMSNNSEILSANQEWYVDSSAPEGGTGTGARPYNNFKSVLDNEALQDGDTVYFAGGQRYVGDNENVNLEIKKNLNLERYGRGDAVFDAEGNSRIFTVTASSINITGLTFQNGNAAFGGAISFNKALSNSNINADFINNTASSDGGANYFAADSGNINITGTFIGNSAYRGGANAFGRSVSGLSISGTYTRNSASNGGANYFNAVSGSNMTGTYLNNSASQGGSIYIRFSSNLIITGTYLNNRLKSTVIHFADSSSGIVIRNAIFMNENYDEDSGMVYARYAGVTAIDNWFGTNASNYNVAPKANKVDMKNWIFLNGTNNEYTVKFFLMSYDGTTASVFDHSLLPEFDLEITAAGGSVDKSTVKLDEAIMFTPDAVETSSVTAQVGDATQTIEINNGDFTILQTLINNASENSVIELTRNYTFNEFDLITDGVRVNKKNLTINGNGFTIDGKGKARIFFIYDDVKISNITFVHGGNPVSNHAVVVWSGNVTISDCIFTESHDQDTSVIFWASDYGCLSDCVFKDNYIDFHSNIISWDGNYGSLLGCTFINNSVGDSETGIIMWTGGNGSISDSVFANNYALDMIILFFNIEFLDLAIDGNIFLDNYADQEIFISFEDNSTITNNWFGHNATDYMTASEVCNQKMDSWLFLNATADPNPLQIWDSSEVTFKIYSYNTTGISDYYNSKWPVIYLSLNATEGSIFNDTVALYEPFTYVADNLGQGSVTAEFDNVECTVWISNIKRDALFSAVVEPQEIGYDENAAIILDYDPIATGTVNIIINGKKHSMTIENVSLNNTIQLPAAMWPDEYEIIAEYSGDGNFSNATATGNLTVNKVQSTLTVSDFEFDYESEGSCEVSFTGAVGVEAEVAGHSEAVVEVGKDAVIVSNLSAGSYTLTVTTVPDENHTAVNANATVTVRKINSSIEVKGYALYYGKSIKITLTTEGAIGITAEMDGGNVEVDGNTITIPNDLEYGDRILAITTVPDNNHVAVTETVEIADCRFVGNVTAVVDGKEYPGEVFDGKVVVDTGSEPVKDNTPIELNVSCIDNYVVFTASVDPDATGIVRFEVSGAEDSSVYMDVVNGIAVVDGSFVVGDYEVVAIYMGDGRFNSNITSESFTVKGHVKRDTPISASADVNGNRVTITVNVDEDATGFVGLKQSESTGYIALENGSAEYAITLPAGSYNVEVTYLGDYDFNENSTRLLFNVVEVAKENTTISLDVETFENRAAFLVSLNENATGIVKFELTGDEENTVYADVNNGIAVLDGLMDAGSYTVTVTYMGDARFNTNVTSESFTVIGHVKKDTPISADADVNGNRVTITVNVDENATGFVNMKFDEAVFNVELEDGIGSFTVNLPANSYNIEVTYLGDENFNENSTRLSFTVEDPVKENTPISLDVSSVDNYATFTVSVDPDATGIVRFEVSGAEDGSVYMDVVNGIAVLDNVLEAGDYEVVAIYLGDDRFNSNITSERFTIHNHVKKDTPISADAKVNGNKVTITVNVEEDATGFVGLKQSGSTVYGALENGVATFVTSLPAGSYNVEATYLGDDDYNGNSTRVLFTVVDAAKENTPISLDISIVENIATFTVDVNENATGLVKFELAGDDEQVIYGDVEDGKAVMSGFIEKGNYTLTVTYMGDGRFNSNATSESFTVKGHVKKDTPISANADVNGFRVGLTVNVDENATGFVNLKLGDTDVNIAVVGGVGSLIADMPANSYIIDVTYLGDENFNENTTRLSFTVEDPVKENTPISLDVSSVENYAEFTVNVNPDATGIVRFEVSGTEEYTVYADVLNGIASLDVVFEAGDYEVVATYMGDNRFNSNITSESFTIMGHVKKDTPISANADVNGNRVTLSVIVDGDATGFVGLKQSGSTVYGALDNGVATFVTTLPAGSYNVEATYLGDDDYNGNSTRVLFTVVDAAKENTPISLDISIVENIATFTVDVNENATGLVKFELAGDDEQVVYGDVVDGKAVMSGFIEKGNYTLTVTYMGDGRFNSNATSESFTVKGHVKKDTPISANAEVSGYRVGLTVNVDENATGFVNLKLGDTDVNIAVVGGVGSLIADMPANSYNIDVTYLGDENFNENTTRLSFTVEDPVKENTPISLDVLSIENYVEFTVNVNPDATGIVRFEVSGDGEYTAYADVLNGVAAMENVLEAGDYNVVATYMGDDRFNSNITSESFTVKGYVKRDTPISASANVNGNKVTISVNVDESATGFVGLKQSGSTVYGALDNGVATFVTSLPAGSYNVEATYLGDDDYNGNSTRLLFNVVDAAKENTPISLDISIVENRATFTVDVNENATGIVKFELVGNNEQVIYGDVVDGKAVMPGFIEIGNYTLTVTYMGDGRFNSNATSESFTVKGHVKRDTPISANAEVSGYRVGITVNVDENATGFVNLKLGDTDVNIAVVGGVGSLIADMPANSYNIDVTYLGDENFNENSTRLSFTVEDPVKENTPISLDVSSVENNATFTVNVNPDATGIVRFEVSGVKEFTVYSDVLNGVAVIEDVLEAGDYTVAATYLGDDRFNSNTTSESFTVKGHFKNDTSISGEVKVNGNWVTITVNVDESATGFVGLNQSGSTVYGALDNGVATFVTSLPAGSYNVEATYLGDENYNENSTILLFTVVEVAKENTTISLDVKTSDNNAVFTVDVNENATGIVKFEIDGSDENKVYAEVNNGMAVAECMMKAGNYTVIVTYMGDSRYNTNVTSKDFTIKDHKKQDTNVSISVPGDISPGEDVPVNVDVPGASGNVTVIIDGVESVVPLVDGKANYTIPCISAGEHTIIVVYSGDDNHSAAYAAKTIDIRLSESKFVDILVSGDAVVTARLVDERGNPIGNANVTYAVNGQSFSGATDANGIIVVNASSTSVVELKYAGSDAVLPANVTVALKDLVHIRTSTEIKSSPYTTYAIDFYTGERGGYFKVQLVDANGNPLASKPVKIGFNGVVYDSTTDSNGWAQLQINLLYSGVYTFAVAFLGDDDYDASFVVQKITVIKKKTTISASAKTFKASAKTKSYTVTLKTDKGSSINGVHMASGKKVTLKVNGKTYSGKTNSKGQVTFKLSITKKGKFSATVKFAGDGTYLASSKSVKITIK